MKALAIKYRPQDFSDVTEQGSIKTILQQQLASGEWKHAYLLCGGAGTGKTTCARIFANELNQGKGNPIELDAASNNGVDDVREIIQQAKTQALDSEYKVFIIDECHAISNAGWQAMLKLIEEPPAKSIFIFCTTDPQKIPKTIISRVQRYDFKKISTKGIFERLHYIALEELGDIKDITIEMEALQYIAKLAEGGMRDAITLLDKCISYSTNITIENVVTALGTVDYDVMLDLTDALMDDNKKEAISIIENIHLSGKDLKQFVKQYLHFLVDVNKYGIGCDWEFITLPRIDEYEEWLQDIFSQADAVYVSYPEHILNQFIQINTNIKYSSTPRYDIEAIILGGK